MSDVELMSIREAIEYAGISYETFRRGMAVGAIPVYRHWSDLRFHRINKSDLDDVLTEIEPRRSKQPNGSGSLRQRLDGRFEFRMTMPNGTRKSVYGRSADEVMAKAEAVTR